MLRKKTVFVVGAGASAEFGLPVGRGLAREISSKLDVRFEHGVKPIGGDIDLFHSVQRAYPNEGDQYQKAGWLIRDGIVLANSIDDFLEIHKNDERVINYGKAAIAKCILEAEAKSSLRIRLDSRDAVSPTTIDFASLDDTWLVKLMRLIGRGLAKPDRAKVFENVRFVVFNYDRCIEHFFVHALRRLYDIPLEEAEGIVSQVTILHPYGSVGALGKPSSQTPTGFGASANYCDLGKTAIKTYSESVESAHIKETISWAEQIVFLGFAFHDQNMGLLANSGSLSVERVIGTAFGISGPDLQIVEGQIGKWATQSNLSLKREIALNQGHMANNVFDFYSKSL
jgi:hypothetical protein